MNEIEQQESRMKIKTYKKDINKTAAVFLWNGLIYIAVALWLGIAIGMYGVVRGMHSVQSLTLYI